MFNTTVTWVNSIAESMPIMVSKCQLSVLLLEGKHAIKRQLYSVNLSPCEK